MIRLAYILCLNIGFCLASMQAQHGISAIYAPSKVIKHRDNLLYNVPSLSNEIRLSYTYQTNGDYAWERFWKKPRIALNAIYVNFGDNEVLGSAFAIVPELHFSLLRYKKLLLNMQFGTGISYLTKPYDAIDNPNNNAIGSNLNNTSSLKFGIEYPWNKRLTTSLSTGIVHFSNGLSSSPNSGINIYGASLNVNYKLTVRQPKDEETITTRNSEESPTYRKWIVDAQYHYGFTEHSTTGGPKYGVQAFSLGAGYRYKEYMTVLAGAEYEYNDGTYTFFKRNFETEEDARRMAKRSILYIENEFRYGAVFNRFRLGFYLGWPYAKTKTHYIKVVTGIYLPNIEGYGKPYIGVILKTHTEVADYLAIMGGISF
ncbi:MAG: hypothetical protein ACJA1A_002242 [Saprospiraceae bacterium]|jgi:hypothetical protein